MPIIQTLHYKNAPYKMLLYSASLAIKHTVTGRMARSMIPIMAKLIVAM
jgi:hypothetical protein